MALNLTYLFFLKFNMSAPRILIIAPSWVGDLIISQAFINALKQINKDSKIDLLVNENLADIAECFPAISNIITSQTRHGKLSLFYRIITGLKILDVTGGFKCFRRETLEKLNLDRIYSNGYSFQIELNFKVASLGLKIKEVPIIFTERRDGQSKMSGGIIKEAIFAVFLLRIRKIFGTLNK